jgi:Calcineurin-like phosphoesterase
MQIMNLNVLIFVACLLFVWIVSYFVMNDSPNFIASQYKNKIKVNEMSMNIIANIDMNDFIPIKQNITPETTVTFYAHGDVPYTRIQARKLKTQMLQLSSDPDMTTNVDFMIHLGDIRMGGPNHSCTIDEYENVATLLQLSPVPVFIILGDNDVHDCPDPTNGLQLWRTTFSNFESQYWNHTTSMYNIIRPKNYPDNFSFQHKNILFIGVNIVGEHIIDSDINDVTQRLTEQVEWVIETIHEYYIECIMYKKMIGRIVLFYHANPGPSTRPFFKPLRHYIGNTLNHSIPILFMNGDAHRYMYQPRFYNASSILRVTVSGLAVDPLLKVTIPLDGLNHDPTDAFRIDRRLTSSVSTSTYLSSHDPVN